jgi:glycerol-3-phosphate cytidylyltransferase-like family protein
MYKPIMQRVALSGTFDGELHIGHINLFKKVKPILTPDCVLSVFIAQDSIIRDYKYREPIYPQAIRAKHVSKVIESLDLRHEIHLFSECKNTNFKRIVTLDNLNIYAFGGDQLSYRGISSWNLKLKEELSIRNIKTIVIPRTKGISTTQLINTNNK